MRTKWNYANRRLKELRTIAILSESILHVNAIKGTPVVLYLRVSARNQTDNLQHQKAELIAAVKQKDCPIVGIFEEVVSGWLEAVSDYNESRAEFFRAILKAKQTGAVVVALSMDRFYRRRRHHGKLLPLTVFHLKRLLLNADGVNLATLKHPDTPPDQVHKEHTERGQAWTGHYGGRPRRTKKKRRESLLPVVLQMWREGGSYRRIGREVNVSWSTVRDWVKDYGKTAHSLTVD